MEENEGKYSMIEERKEIMVSPNNNQPILRKSHFLKPIINPNKIQSFPKFNPPKQPLNPNLELINKRVSFRGIIRPLKHWKTWVNNLQKTHEKTWKKAGIFEAIKGSTYYIIKEDKLIIELAENWCCETNTFVFPWGECTVTLEDVMILGGFSILGNSAKNEYKIPENNEDVMVKRLVEIRREIQENKRAHHCTHKKWLNYFMGIGGELEHVGLIVLWLSRYVFPTYSMITTTVFSIAVRVVRGARFAFAPLILALIYRDLRLLKGKIVSMVEGNDDGSKLLLHGPLGLVQLWAWERFSRLSPRACTIEYGEPRVARWAEVKWMRSGDWRAGFVSAGGEFLWRPYAVRLENWEFPKFYCDHEKWVLVDYEDEEVVSFAKCLMTCELVGVDCVEKYFPQRVARQFAYDQDIPFLDARLGDCSELDGMKLYLPPRLCEGDMSLRYLNWWRTSLVHVDSDFENRRRGKRKFENVSESCGDDQNLNDKGNAMCLSSDKAAGLYSVGNNSEMHVLDCEANAAGFNTVMNRQVVTKHEGEYGNNVMEKDKERKMNCSYDNMCEGSKMISSRNHNKDFASEFVSLGSANSNTGLETDRVYFASNAVQSPVGDAKLKHGQSSVGDPVYISSDDECTDAVKVIEESFETRISKLERIISSLLAAKVKAKAA